MKRLSVAVCCLLGVVSAFAAASECVKTDVGYAYRAYLPGAVKPTGFLAEFARRQAEGTLSHRHEASYPFDQELWAQAITNLHYANPMWRAPDRPYSENDKKHPWVPYEQTAYMLDGMARLSFLVDAPGIRADYLKSLDSVLANAAPDGKLARWYDNCDHWLEWPFVIFARSAFATFEGTGDKRILDALVRHYDSFGTEGRRAWVYRELYNVEMMLLLSRYTGNEQYVKDAVWMWENSPEWKRLLTEKRILEHGVTFTEPLKIPAMLTLFTGDRRWLEQGERNLDDAFELNEQPDGMISANEFLSGRDPRQGHEACVVSDMIWTLGYYLEADGRAIDADRMERIAYNALPGHMTKDFRRYQYLSFVNQAQVTPFSSPTHFAPRAKHAQYRPNLFFECCLGNIQRALPNFILRMWMKDEKTGAPVAMLHGPSKLSSEYKGVKFTVEEVTEYPFSDKVKFVFHSEKPVEMPLKYRVPMWAKRPDAGTLACETRLWKDGDAFETEFPSDVKLKSDRNWHWFAKGALAFAYPVPSNVAEERPGDPYSPLVITPNGPWNWAVDPAKLAQEMPVAEYRPNGKFPYDEPPLTLKVPVQGLAEWRVFDSGKWMPDPPLFAHPSGEKATVTLVPGGATLARVMAFPDVTPRKELPVPCAYVYDGKRHDYDPKRPLAEQKAGPETDGKFSFDFILKDDPPQQGLDDFYDLGNRFDTTKNSMAYLVFAVWSDEARTATAALSGAHCWQVFGEDGREIARNIGVQEGRYMMPEWFPITVRPGYNWVVVKVATPWRNRLIGDHFEPDDCEWGLGNERAGNGVGRPLHRLPDFVLKGTPRPSSGRITFATWDYFGINSPLVPSGLIGPIRLTAEK